MSDDTKVIADHYRRERAAAVAAGTIPIDEYTVEEAKAAIAAIPDDVARDVLSRNFSTSNEGSATVPDLTDAELKGHIDAQAARHAATRIERTRAPFEDAYGRDVQQYGPDSPVLVGNGVDNRLRNAAEAAKTPEEQARYREAIGYKPSARGWGLVSGLDESAE